MRVRFIRATTLRALGPETGTRPTQPSRRPTDGRYGENPNRLQHYYQYQVIMKPSPDDFQELYLGSLYEIGIDPKNHDIRFVEDDWESPTLGAWGLGWEVWCDGMEVSQFTYFQQVGGFDCSPVSGELTYGLERLAMYVQGVDNVYDLDFNGRGVSYGDVFLQAEREYSAHNFEHANTEMLFRHFADAEAECHAIAGQGLALPAYDQCIKASHVFNLAGCARRDQRDRARRLYRAGPGTGETLRRGMADQPWAPDGGGIGMTELLLELFSEEIPARMQDRAASDLARPVQRRTEAGIEAGDVIHHSTPRRLCVVVEGLPEVPPMCVTNARPRRPMRQTRPSKVFCASTGLTRDDLEVRETPKGNVLFAVIEKKGSANRRGPARHHRDGHRQTAVAQIHALGRTARALGATAAFDHLPVWRDGPASQLWPDYCVGHHARTPFPRAGCFPGQ